MSEVDKIMIDLLGANEYTIINFNLNILINSLDQTKLIGQLVY